MGAVLKKSAAAKGLSEAEIEEARLVAINAVKEALRKPGGLPPPSPDSIFSSACNLRVEGLPLYNSKGQRCCKVDQMTSGLNIGPQGPRGLEGEDGGGEGEGTPLPGVLRTQRTGAVEGQEVTCFPSFIIAGTQKSGTTALTGEKQWDVGCGVGLKVVVGGEMPPVGVVPDVDEQLPPLPPRRIGVLRSEYRAAPFRA